GAKGASSANILLAEAGAGY
ncbi:hypothetical protein AVDCRST_MAG94-3118, partial [uncultured Leptolyngbya sp.]